MQYNVLSWSWATDSVSVGIQEKEQTRVSVLCGSCFGTFVSLHSSMYTNTYLCEYVRYSTLSKKYKIDLC